MEAVTLVLGASVKPERYSNMAIRRLRAHGHPVLAIGLREGMVQDVPLVTGVPAETRVDTVTMYLNAANQAQWEKRILGLRPRRIIFNPGAENPSFAQEAQAAGIEVVEACTLVMLGTGQY